MPALTLSLEKADAPKPPTLQLSLTKGAVFHFKISWDCHADHEDDLDIHALEARNDGNGAKVSSLKSILSTHNTKKMSRDGALPTNPDGSFGTPSGGLRHGGDVRKQGQFEIITIDGSKIPNGVNEIPLIATVFKAEHGEEHDADHDSEEEAAFADIELCKVTITDQDDKELGSYVLSDEFGEFNVVQLGSVLLTENGWEYAPVGSGFNGDFNSVLACFS